MQAKSSVPSGPDLPGFPAGAASMRRMACQRPPRKRANMHSPSRTMKAMKASQAATGPTRSTRIRNTAEAASSQCSPTEARITQAVSPAPRSAPVKTIWAESARM